MYAENTIETLSLHLMFPYNFVTIDGNTGAGKTSLAKKISEDFKGNLILEQFIDNPFLPKTYQFKEKGYFAFQNELYFLVERYQQLRAWYKQADLSQGLHISDYVFKKSLLYAQVNIKDDDERKLFNDIYGLLFESLPEPDLLIYIHSTADRLVNNIQKRGRDFEQQVLTSYLKDVEDIYFKYFEDHQHLRILVLHCDEIDFVNNPADYKKVLSYVCKEYEAGIHHLYFN